MSLRFPGSVHKSPVRAVYIYLATVTLDCKIEPKFLNSVVYISVKTNLDLQVQYPSNTTCMPLPIEPFLDVKELQERDDQTTLLDDRNLGHLSMNKLEKFSKRCVRHVLKQSMWILFQLYLHFYNAYM